MMQMPSDTYVSDYFGVFHHIFEIRGGIISLKSLMKIVLFVLYFGNDWCLESLSVLLFDHDLSFRVHFLMGLIIFFILMEDNSMLIGGIENFNIRSQCGLLF